MLKCKKGTCYLHVQLLKQLRKEANDKYYVVRNPYHMYEIIDDDKKYTAPRVMETHTTFKEAREKVDDLRYHYIINIAKLQEGAKFKRVY